MTQIHWGGFWSTIKSWAIIDITAGRSIIWTILAHFGTNSGHMNVYQTGNIGLQGEIGQEANEFPNSLLYLQVVLRILICVDLAHCN